MRIGQWLACAALWWCGCWWWRLSGLTPTPLGAREPGKKFGAEGCGHPVVLLRARTSDSLIDDLPAESAPGEERSEGVLVEDVVDYCAGLDVHRDTVVATVRFPEGNRRCSVTKTFGTDTTELVALGDWLISQ